MRRGVLPPAAQVILFSDKQWERFIEAAARMRPTGYARVQRLGSAGDAGRDVEARLDAKLSVDRWDLFQGKHYDHALAPGEAFPELAKFFTHLAAGTFPRPRHYYFCAPKSLGPHLHDLLEKPAVLKAQFLESWQKGQQGLKEWIPKLTPDVEKLVRAFDFSRFCECLVRDLIKWHARDPRAHYALFGFETERGDDPVVPTTPHASEQVYVEELRRVYEEHAGSPQTLDDICDVAGDYAEHFYGSRTQFYCAEGLRRFSRDLFPEDEFGALLEMVLKGVRPKVSNPKLKTGIDRVEAATEAASALKLTDSRLSPRLRPGDMPGTCHQLVNEKKLKWIK